ncbi:TetR family transcriptional regulator [Rhodobacterales bacterium HKCCE2091]|nr:TetR family transcriptional regulator [Rhodobacterales bacterium HKCCE2091]
MKADRRQARQAEIEAAAYALIEQGGEGALTMQALARAAGASMETLYRWYGDRTGLFAALVARNAEDAASGMSMLADGDPMAALARLGPKLLAMVTGDRAVALNRAAAADPTGTLGAALAASGRDAVVPRIADAIARAMDRGALGPGDPAEAAETFIALLLGDLQIRRAIRAIPAPSPDTCAARAEAALAALRRLYPPVLDEPARTD